MNLYMWKAKSPDILTVEQIQNISAEDKAKILSYLGVSEEIQKVTKFFRFILSADTKLLIWKWITDISQEIDVKEILDKLPYPTKDAMHQILEKEFTDTTNIENK